jgi:hypothetical protein
MYRVTELHFYVNTVAGINVIVFTDICVPTLYLKNWMIAQFYDYIENSMILKVRNLIRNMFMEILILILYIILYFTICIYSYFIIFLLLCYYLYEFAYRLWNILTVLTVILSHIHFPLMFCHYISCIYSYRLKYINCNIVQYSYFPNVLSLHILCI